MPDDSNRISNKRTTAPALPIPPAEYNVGVFGQLNNALRIYFRFLDEAINALISESRVVVQAYTIVTGDYTLTFLDSVIEYTEGSYTATLPTAIGATGREYTVKNSGVGTIRLAAPSGELIDDCQDQPLQQYDAIKAMSNGTNWIII